MSVMNEITVSHTRARLADVVDAARVGHDPLYLTRRGSGRFPYLVEPRGRGLVAPIVAQ